jgi:hypothetical protein
MKDLLFSIFSRIILFVRRCVNIFSTSDSLLKLIFLIFLLHLSLSIVTQYTPITEGFLSLIIFVVTLLLFFLFVLKLLNDAIFFKTLNVREEFINVYLQNELAIIGILHDQLILIFSQNFLLILLKQYSLRVLNTLQVVGGGFFVIIYILSVKSKFLKYFLGLIYYKDFMYVMSNKRIMINKKKKVLLAFIRLLRLKILSNK